MLMRLEASLTFSHVVGAVGRIGDRAGQGDDGRIEMHI